jgi:hypothetical protein
MPIEIGIAIGVAQAEMAAANRRKMESIPISIAIWIPMKPIKIDGVLGFTATNPVVRPAPRLWRGKWWVGCERPTGNGGFNRRRAAPTAPASTPAERRGYNTVASNASSDSTSQDYVPNQDHVHCFCI